MPPLSLYNNYQSISPKKYLACAEETIIVTISLFGANTFLELIMTLITTTSPRPLTDTEIKRINAYWRAANYLSVGQIYLLDNPLLREPLKQEHVKPRLLGHWGTTPGLNLIYAHLNRVIKKYDLNAIYIAGPGHGGPGIVANTYFEGT